MYHAHLAFQNMPLTELPGAPFMDTEVQLSPSKFCRILHHAMPLAWQDKFADASKTTQNSTLIDLLNYMQQQSDKNPLNTLPSPSSSTTYSSDSEGSHSTHDNPEPNNKPRPLPGHSHHTIAQCREQRYPKQQQANSDDRNLLSQAP